MDSSSDEESDNDIVGWKKQSRYTSPDHRAKLALKSDEVTRLRILCTLIEDQEKFQDYVLVLFTSLYALKMESERRLANTMLNAMIENDNSMDSESVDSVLSDFNSNDEASALTIVMISLSTLVISTVSTILVSLETATKEAPLAEVLVSAEKNSETSQTISSINRIIEETFLDTHLSLGIDSHARSRDSTRAINEGSILGSRSNVVERGNDPDGPVTTLFSFNEDEKEDVTEIVSSGNTTDSRGGTLNKTSTNTPAREEVQLPKYISLVLKSPNASLLL